MGDELHLDSLWLYIDKKNVLWLSLGSKQYRAGRVYDLFVYFMRVAPESSPKVVLWRSWESNLQPLVYKAQAYPYTMTASLNHLLTVSHQASGI